MILFRIIADIFRSRIGGLPVPPGCCSHRHPWLGVVY
jgi:hypothetical protein